MHCFNRKVEPCDLKIIIDYHISIVVIVAKIFYRSLIETVFELFWLHSLSKWIDSPSTECTEAIIDPFCKLFAP